MISFKMRTYAEKLARKQILETAIITLVLTLSSLLIGFIVNGFREAFLVSFGIIFGIIIYKILIEKVVPKSNKFKGIIQGIDGEKKVYEYLKDNLPKSFEIITNLEFTGSKGDIDILVIGHNRIYAIECKTHKGTLQVYQDKWYQVRENGTSKDISYSPSKQIKNNARILCNFLKFKFPEIEGLFILSYVILPNKDTKLKIKKEPEHCKIFTNLSDFVKEINKREGETLNFISKNERDKIRNLLWEEIVKEFFLKNHNIKNNKKR